MTRDNSEKFFEIKRFLDFENNYSFFLFGPRGCGKTTLIKNRFSQHSIFIDLLDPDLEKRFSTRPGELKNIVNGLDKKIKYVIIDEIQKVPKLLDVVHMLIENSNKHFILTGSSARKLKYGQANLLAGRAFTYNLYPLTSIELGKRFDLNLALTWGLLPKIYKLKNPKSKTKFLQAYTHSYLKEEIWAEHFIRNLDPFRSFLEVAAQMNGKILNLSSISRDVGVDDKTIKEYYSILEDTLLGFSLHSFKHSFRKQLSTKPKFYFFDPGVKRALTNSLSIPLQESSYAYGEAFEHFIVLECIKLASYFKDDYRFSYLRTKDGAEADLVIERPGKLTLFIEIKSSSNVQKESLNNFISLTKDFGKCEAVCFSNDPYMKVIENVKIMPWQKGLKEYFC